MKSPPSRGSDAPHVHPRLRKRLSRCTLDCGFKTSESPALRGFVVGPRALATAALYLVLKSNGLHRPKIRLKKFSFSLKIVPAYISKKLPSQCWPKSLFIAFFNFSHKWPTFAFTSESGYTLGFRRKIAHNGSHGGTAMRLCASLFQGVAAPLGCVIFFRFCRNYGFHTLCSGLSACARHRRYHYPRRALRASETLDSRLSKRLSCYSFRPS